MEDEGEARKQSHPLSESCGFRKREAWLGVGTSEKENRLTRHCLDKIATPQPCPQCPLTPDQEEDTTKHSNAKADVEHRPSRRF